MWRKLGDWSRIIQLMGDGSTVNDKLMEDLWNSLAELEIEQGQWLSSLLQWLTTQHLVLKYNLIIIIIGLRL